MFKERIVVSNELRSFRITIGLTEGYSTGITHTVQDVADLIKRWMLSRMETNGDYITGGALVPCTFIYGWGAKMTSMNVNQEDSVLFMGEINPMYSASMTDDQAEYLLRDLASFIGTELKQCRMYVVFKQKIIVLQNQRITHPTEKIKRTKRRTVTT